MEKSIQMNNSIRRKLRAALPLLSLAVIIGVFWWLKLTGLTMAGEAFCGMQEHVHGEDCRLTLVCTETEERIHTHEADCRKQVLACTLQETEGHTHGDACYGRGLVCKEEHTHDETACYGNVLQCGLAECAPHTHGADCYREELVCQLPEFGPHTHGDACYESSCGLKAHTHVESCYSNIKADLETTADWTQLFAQIEEETGTKSRVVKVALSQLGYQESVANFQVDDFGVRRGITRYGQWYGNPYGDWNAMFTSFCLHYAGIKDAPANGGPEAMRLEWEAAGLYRTDTQSLQPGDVLFLRKGEETTADAVAIITAVEETGITAMAGDVDNAVAEVKYALDDASILGYGTVPAIDTVVMLAPAAKAAGDVTIWLDGTNGGMGHLKASENTPYTVQEGSTLKLPETWPSPDKYSYKLRGWYDITNSKYYAPGAEMEVTGNAVLYADWVAASYDVGVYNEHVVNTPSTSDFITTYLFDYNYLFNVYSTKADISVDSKEHSESWTQVSSGKVAHNDTETLDFVFVSNDASRTFLGDPGSRSKANSYHAPGEDNEVNLGIFEKNDTVGKKDNLYDLLFGTGNSFDPATGQGVLGKTYVGTADHLYQLMDDPDDEHYGYYYYDSRRNAAFYNQSAGRFYVYDYLSATSDSLQDGRAYSDFLPFNSPYVNTNGKKVGTYSYDGINGEYKGVTHYRFDSRYNTGDYNDVGNAMANYGYGMRSDIDFYLPNNPGSADANKDVHGNNMRFEFSGDDDVWILIDGKLVLDIGGIHQVTSGFIDFSTGKVSAINGKGKNIEQSDLSIEAGEHVLTLLYLERGSSMSNCAIYFNLAPRYQLTIQKEDVLTRHLLENAEFAVYTDRTCTTLAHLWNNKAESDAGMAPRESFIVDNGSVTMWGFAANETYYIKEISPPRPDNVLVGESPYSCASGLISVHIDRLGNAVYDVEMIEELDENGNPIPIANGFTAYGFRFDEETHHAYLVVTNAEKWVEETTEVTAVKKWADTKDHSGDAVTVYLTVTDPDGTVRRLQDMVLSQEDNWQHTWTNLPKYQQDGVTPIDYGVEEALVPGYYDTVERADEIKVETVAWEAVGRTYSSGETYLLQASGGYLSGVAGAETLALVNEATAKSSPLAQWTITGSGTSLKLVNGDGQILTFQNSGTRRFYTSKSQTNIQGFGFKDVNNQQQQFRLYYDTTQDRYFSGVGNDGYGSQNTRENNGTTFTLVKKTVTSTTKPAENLTYLVTNTPLDRATSVTVGKVWNTDQGGAGTYETLDITIRLFADGKDTRHTVNLNLQNGWTDVFQNLPYADTTGKVIEYTVEEVVPGENWKPSYALHTDTSGQTPTYTIAVTNTYEDSRTSVELPSTGSAARMLHGFLGGGLMLLALAAAVLLRRKRYI